MFPLLEARFLAPDVKLFRIQAPRVARKRKAGQFVILRVHEHGERIPITIADSDAERRRRSRSSSRASARPPSCSTRWRPATPSSTSSGRSGSPPRSSSFGTAVVIGGGVGAAIAYPTAVALKKAGNRVISILGGRTRDLVILEDEIRAASDEVHVTTDDGSYGEKGLVTDALQKLIDAGADDRLRAGHRPDPDDAGGRRDHPPPRHPDRRQPELDHGRRNRHVRGLPGEHRREEPVRLRRRTGVRRPPRWTSTSSAAATRCTAGRRPRPWTGSSPTPRSELARVPGHRCRLEDAEVEGMSQRTRIKPKERIKIPRQKMPEQDPAARARNFQEVNLGLAVGRRPDRGHALPRVQEAGVRPRLSGRGQDPRVRRPGPRPGTTGPRRPRCARTTCCRRSPAASARRRTSARAPASSARSSSPLAIGYLERFIADWERESGKVGLPPRAPPTGKKVAIVGSGPAVAHRRRRPRPEGATTSPSSRPCTRSAASWSTASPSSACPRTSCAARSTTCARWA